MWTYVFRRTRALINIALHRYMFPNSSRYQLSISDAEILVEFEKVIQGKFELATDELLDNSSKILRALYSQFREAEIFATDPKEARLLVEAVTGERLRYVDGKILSERLTDENNFKRGLDGLEAELYVLSVEIAKFRESPALYDRIYRQAKRFYFEFNRDTLDPDGKIIRALYAVHDESELQRELALAFFRIKTSPANTKDIYDLCLNIVLGCHDKRMLSDFIQPPKGRGRKKNSSLHDFITTEIGKLAKKGIVSLPSKNALYKILTKLRNDARVRAHFEML